MTTIQESPFRNLLEGPTAFYKHPDYIQETVRDLSQKKALSPKVVYRTEPKIAQIVKQILTVVIFPIGVYRLFHCLIGKIAVLPASTPFILGYPQNHANDSRNAIRLNGVWKYKRITLEVDGKKVDAMIIGKPTTLHSRRWMLFSNGNGEFYEDSIRRNNFKRLLEATNSNGIVFNYSGVGSSTGIPSRQSMVKSYRAILKFLEEEVKAEEIICYGHSIGAGVQADALDKHTLNPGIKYVFVKSRTFSSISDLVASQTISALGIFIKALGWNIDPAKSSKKLAAPEVILQTARPKNPYDVLTHSRTIVHDGVIPPAASLGKKLLDNPDSSMGNKARNKAGSKIVIGMHERHNDGLCEPGYLAAKIEELLH